jgi:2-hydroxy-3-oxopropionate reductase
MLTVGYIGLGLMGKAMARNLLNAGFPVVVYNRSRPAMDELVAEGAFAASSPAEVARKVKVVFTNLPDTPDVLKVVLGEKGIIQGVHPGLIYVDNSTIKPDAAREIAEKLESVGIAALDAPVSGGDIGAREGTLTIMVGGSKEAFDTVKPVFQAMGKTITYIGDAGAGQIAKAANQIMVAAQMVAMGELLIFAQKCGTDPRKVIEAISAGSARCWALDVKPKRLFEGNRTPGFKAKLQSKDLGIVLDTARLHGIPLPGTAVNSQLFQAMLENGLGEMDNSGVISIIEMLAGEKLDTETKNEALKGQPSTTSQHVKQVTPAKVENSTPTAKATLSTPPSRKEIPTPKIADELTLPVKKEVQPEPQKKEVTTSPAKKETQLTPKLGEVSKPAETSEVQPVSHKKETVAEPDMKETPPFLETPQIPEIQQSEKIRASRSKTTPL